MRKRRWSCFLTVPLLPACVLNAGCGLKHDDNALGVGVVQTRQVTLPIPENAELVSMDVHGNEVYYGISYVDYYGGYADIDQPLAFDASDNTQVRKYDYSTGEDTLAYQYDENEAVEITDLQYMDGAAVWEDYLGGNRSWRIVTAESSGAFTALCAGEQLGSQMWSVTPLAKDDALYWHDLDGNASDGSLFSLYRYQDGLVEAVRNNILLSTPYAHPFYADGCFATVEAADGGGYATRWQEDGNVSAVAVDAETTSGMQANSDYWIWMDGNTEAATYDIVVCDADDEEMYNFSFDYFFSYGLLGHYLIVNTQDNLLCYDLNQGGEETVLLDGGTYMYTFQTSDGVIYAENLGENGQIVVITEE